MKLKQLLFLFVFMFGVVLAVGATVLTTDPKAEYSDTFTTFASLVGVIPIVVEFVKNLLKFNTPDTPGWVKQLISWIIGIAITMFGWYFKLGFLNGLDWYYALMWGIGASLAANGVADTKIIQWAFGLFIKQKIT